MSRRDHLTDASVDADGNLRLEMRTVFGVRLRAVMVLTGYDVDSSEFGSSLRVHLQSVELQSSGPTTIEGELAAALQIPTRTIPDVINTRALLAGSED